MTRSEPGGKSGGGTPSPAGRATQGTGWGPSLRVLSPGLLALWGALQGWAGRVPPESQASRMLFLLPRHFTPRLIRHDQTERSSQRLPQRHHARGADMEDRGEDTAWSQGGLCGWGWTVLHPALLAWSPCGQPHPLLRHQPLLILLPLPALLTLTLLVGLLFLSQLSVWLRREAGKLGVLGGQPLLSLGHADGACSFQLPRQLL